nr:hypothetical protein [Nocardia niwae]
MPIHPSASGVEQDRSAAAVTDRAVDAAPDRWWERDQRDLVALADHTQHAVAVFFADIGDVEGARFEDPQPEHHHRLQLSRHRGRLAPPALSAWITADVLDHADPAMTQRRYMARGGGRPQQPDGTRSKASLFSGTDRRPRLTGLWIQRYRPRLTNSVEMGKVRNALAMWMA